MYRCPYCHAELKPPLRGVCSACGRGMRVQLKISKEERKQRREARAMIQFEASRVRKGMGGCHSPYRRGVQAGVALVIMFVVGALLIGRARMAPTTRTSVNYRMLDAEQALDVLRVALERFKDDNARFPSDEEGLLALVHDPGVTNWRGPYVTVLTGDPWNSAYVYRAEETNVVVASMGPDGVDGTDDDMGPTDWELLYESRPRW